MCQQTTFQCSYTTHIASASSQIPASANEIQNIIASASSQILNIQASASNQSQKDKNIGKE